MAGAVDAGESKLGVTSASTIDDLAIRVQSSTRVIIQIDDAGGMAGTIQVKGSTNYDPTIKRGKPAVTGSFADISDPVPMDKPTKMIHLTGLPLNFISFDTSSLVGTADIRVSTVRGGA